MRIEAMQVFGWNSAGIFLSLIGLIWLTRRPPRVGAAVDAGGAH